MWTFSYKSDKLLTVLDRFVACVDWSAFCCRRKRHVSMVWWGAMAIFSAFLVEWLVCLHANYVPSNSVYFIIWLPFSVCIALCFRIVYLLFAVGSQLHHQISRRMHALCAACRRRSQTRPIPLDYAFHPPCASRLGPFHSSGSFATLRHGITHLISAMKTIQKRPNSANDMAMDVRL